MADPRYVFDEDLQGVGALIQTARSDRRDVWVIGKAPCPIDSGTPDEDWLPEAGRRKLVIFRIDSDLLKAGSASHLAWHRNGCRGFVLTVAQSKSSLWNQLRALVRQWDRIDNHCADRAGDGSWLGRITLNEVKPVV